MLKNKFGMTKVLLLVLSVLMVVSLAACKKDGDDTDYNAVISEALAEQSRIQASKDAEAAAFQKAELDKIASENAAAQSSLREELEQVSDDVKNTTKATTPAPTTPAPTTAPIVVPGGENIAAQVAEFSNLKTEYTYTNSAMYLAEDYAELVLLFDKAGVDLNNALTVDAAKAILATLKVDIAAITNVQTAADAVQAQIAALGDIETEVFLTQAEKITAARKAYSELKNKYNVYMNYDVEEKADNKSAHVDTTVEIAEDLGINLVDLEKAELKLVALEKYIENSLKQDMAALYKADPKQKYVVKDLHNAVAGETYETIIDRAYYKYLVLAVINGGDLTSADLPTDWEYEVDEKTGGVVRAEKNSTLLDPWGVPYGEKDKIFDEDQPIAWFTAEELLNVYILPTLDAEFDEIKTDVLDELKGLLDNDTYTALVAEVNTLCKDDKGVALKPVAEWNDVEDIFSDAIDAFENDLEALSFVNNYKGTATLADAEFDLYTLLLESYVEALSAIVGESKEYAIEIYTDYVYDVNVDELETKYDDDDDAATLAELLASEAADLATFTANVNAAPAYDFAALNAAELRDEYSSKNNEIKELVEYINEDTYAIDAKFFEYVEAVIVDAINNNFDVVASGDKTVVQSAELRKIVRLMVEDLEALIERLDPTGTAAEADLYVSSKKGSEVKYLDDETKEKYIDSKYYDNTEKFEKMVADLEAAIDALEAVSVADYADKDTQVTTDNEKSHKDNKDKPLYYRNEAAKNYVWNYSDKEADVWTLLYNDADKNLDKNDKVADYVTLNATDYPVVYTYTAEEQAQKAAYDIYNAAFTAVHKELVSINGIASAVQKKINDTDTYKDVLDRVAANADLKAEVEAFAKIFTDKISTNANTLKYGCTGDAFTAAVSVATRINKTGDYVTVKTSLDNTAAYNYTNVNANIEEIVNVFDALFYNTDKTESNVVTLWTYKTQKAEEIANTMKLYKNEYGVDADNKPKQTFASEKYVYDVIATAASTKGAAYEAALDALLADYTAKIMGVKLSSTTEVKDYYEFKINAFTETNWATTDKPIDLKTKYNIASSKAIVDAYISDLFGYAKTAGVAETVYTVADITGAEGDLKFTSDNGTVIDLKAEVTKTEYATNGIKLIKTATYDKTWNYKVNVADTVEKTAQTADIMSRVFQAYKLNWLGNFETVDVDTVTYTIEAAPAPEAAE